MLARLFWVGMFTMAWLVPGSAAPRTIDISDKHGGSVAAYSQRWKHLAAEGVHVRIVGACQSACTVLLGYIPREHICVMPAARFGFHLAHKPEMQAVLWHAYAPDIRSWINSHGGLAPSFKWMGAPDTYRYFHRC
jgi:hypothetical protein